jgi:hypothetical protein
MQEPIHHRCSMRGSALVCGWQRCTARLLTAHREVVDGCGLEAVYLIRRRHLRLDVLIYRDRADRGYFDLLLPASLCVALVGAGARLESALLRLFRVLGVQGTLSTHSFIDLVESDGLLLGGRIERGCCSQAETQDTDKPDRILEHHRVTWEAGGAARRIRAM